ISVLFEGACFRLRPSLWYLNGRKNERSYYRDNLLAQKLLPDIRRISQGEFLSLNRMAPLRIEHATLSLSWSEKHPTSCLQHCGRRTHQILTQSTIAYGVYCRRRFTAPE